MSRGKRVPHAPQRVKQPPAAVVVVVERGCRVATALTPALGVRVGGRTLASLSVMPQVAWRCVWLHPAACCLPELEMSRSRLTHVFGVPRHPHGLARLAPAALLPTMAAVAQVEAFRRRQMRRTPVVVGSPPAPLPCLALCSESNSAAIYLCSGDDQMDLSPLPPLPMCPNCDLHA